MRLGLGLGLVRLGKAIASFVRDGLKLYYPFRDNDPELLLSGATSFDGSDDYINAGADSSLNLSVFTISLWVNFADGAGAEQAIRKWGSNRGIAIGTSGDSTNKFRFQASNSSSEKYVDSSTTVVANTWYHLTGTADGSNIKLYVNGSLENTVSSTITLDTASDNLYIGGFTSVKLNGKIANFGIWNRALSASEIESIYWKGQYADLKGTELTNLVSWYNLKETGFGSDVVTNGDLWTGASGSTRPTGWSGSGSGTPTHTIVDLSSVTNFDSTTLRFTATDTRSIYQNVVTSGVTYKVEFAYRTDSSSNYIHIGSSGNKITLSNTGLSGDATLVSQEITSNGSAVGIQIITDDSTIEISSIQVYPVSAPDSEGTNNGTIVGATTLTDAYSASSPFLPRIQDKASDTVANYGEVYGGNAVSFDGASDYIDIADYSGNIYAVSLWFKPNSSISTTDFEALLGFGAGFQGVYLGNATGSIANELISVISGGSGKFSYYSESGGELSANWHHLIINWNSIGSNYDIFLNGVNKFVGTLSSPTIISADEVIIGGRLISGSINNPFTGLINNVKVFNTSLTQDQVRQLYIKPELTLPTGIASSALKLDMPMQEGSGTAILDGSGNQNHGTGSGITWANGQEYGFQHPLVRSNNPMVFDGADDKVSVGTPSALNNIFTGGGTLSAWINPKSDGQNNAGQAFDKVKYAFQVISESSGSVKVQFAVTLSGGAARWETPLSVPLNTWTHILVTYDSDNPTTDPIIYLNGSAVTLTETISPSGTWVSDASSNLTLGNRNDGVTTFDGLLNDLAIWSSTLTANEVTALYNSGLPLLPTTDSGNYASSSDLVGYWRNDGVTTWLDRSTNSNNGTVSGSPASIIVPEGLNEGRDSQGYYLTDTDSISSGIRFKGAEYIDVQDSESLDFGTSDFTLECWLKTTDQGFVRILDKRNSSSGYTLNLNTSEVVHLELNDGSGNTGFASSTAVNDGNWHHIAVSVNRSSNALFYIDGSLDATQNISAKNGSLDSTSNLIIGADAPNGDSLFLNGSIDEIKIYKGKVLSASEVLKNYNNGKSAHSN